MQSQKLGLYLHTPFCEHKCGYCDFNSWAETSVDLQWRWLKGVKQEFAFWLKHWKFSFEFDSFFFGGGTPSLLDPEVLSELFSWMKRELPFSSQGEWSLECNPETLTEERLELFQKFSVNRLSVGIQSFQDPFLKKLERKTTAARNRQALALLEKFWPFEWSLDLMFGLPGQELSDWQKDLKEAVQYSMNHLSAYQLTLSTPKARLWKQKEEDDLCEYAEWTRNFLSDNDLAQYEVSNFARSNEHQCRHNLKYWQLQPFLGIGPGAYSLLTGPFSQFLSPEEVNRFGIHYKSPSHFETWLRDSANLALINEKKELRGPELHLQELFIQNLRLNRGLEHKRVLPLFSEGIPASLKELICLEEGYLRTTPRGSLLLDYLCRELLALDLPSDANRLDPGFGEMHNCAF